MEIRLLDESAANKLPALALYLAARFPLFVTRSELIESLWPETSPESARNRLRVALSRLRAEIELEEQDDRLRLCPETVRVDVIQFLQRWEEIRHEPDPETEWIALLELLPQFAKRVLPHRSEPWLGEMQNRWSLGVSEGVSRLLVIAKDRREWRNSLRAAECGLVHFPYDSTFWHAKLEALRNLGRGIEGVRAFAAKRQELRREGGDFDEDLREFARSLEESGGQGADLFFTQGESELILRTVHRAMESEPEVAVALLGSTSFRPELLRSPAEGYRLLREVAQQNLPESEALSRVRVRIITSLALLQRDDEVLPEAEKVLAIEQHPHRRRIVLLNYSWSLFQVGRVEEAFTAIEEAIRLAESTHYELDAWQCRSQRASYLLLIGRVEESIPIYESAVEFLNKTPDGATDRDTLIIDCNLALAYHLLGQNEQAIARLRPIRETARKARMADPLARAETLLGACLAQLGERAEASECLRSGLKAAYPKGPREALHALGDSLVALKEWNHPDAARLSQAWSILLTHYEVPLTYPLRWRIAVLNSTESSEPVDLLNTVRGTLHALREV